MGLRRCSRSLGAGITAFYMTRLIFMTFLGERRWAEDVHPHESPLVMTVPMIILAVGSVVLGAFLVLNGRIAELARAGRSASTEEAQPTCLGAAWSPS